MKRICVGMGVVLSVLLLVIPASARSLKSALEREMFGGAPSLLTVGGQPLLSADPRNFGRPILAIGKIAGQGTGAGLSRKVTETMGSEILSESGVVPVPSGSSGITFGYDPTIGFYKPLDIGLGPIFNERVNTLGQGHFAFGVAYVRQGFDEYNGDDLSSLRVDDELFADPPDLGVLIEDGSVQATLDLDITTNSVAVWGTYGLTDWLDVSFLLPITVIDFKARSTVSIVNPEVRNGTAEGRLRNGLAGFLPDSQCTIPRANRNECRIADFIFLRQGTRFMLTDPGTGEAVGQSGFSNVVDETKTGISDLLLRAKAQFFEKNGVAFGGLVEFTLPTGDKDNFLGDDAFKTRVALLYSQRFWSERVGFHLNFGGRVTTQTSQKNGLEYGSALDWRATEWLTLVAEFTASQRLDAEGLPDDFFHGAFGFKTSPVPGLVLNASFRIPVNDDGLRSDLVYLVGLEYDF